MNIVEAAISAPWAMLPERVEELVAIASRENSTTPEALEAYRSARADNGERLKIRENVAILDVSGPLFKKANLFVAFSGATSYEILRRDLQAALDDKTVDAIMINVDSPGGEANGCDELAAAIFAARAKKPVTAYVSGMAASGGYWIASAADKVVVSDLAVLGSIGVVLGITDRKKAEEKAGISRLEFVSSQSPGKRPNVETDEGKARIQKMVDDLASVFVSAVSKHRNVTPDTVIKKFGGGGVEVGANAVALGMADEVGQFEAAFAALSTRGKNRRFQRSGGSFMSTTETADIAKIQAEAAAKAKSDERTRISAITGTEAAKAHPKLAKLLVDADLSSETAISFLNAAAEDTKAAVDAKTPAVDPAKAAADEAAAKAKAFEKKKAEAGALGLGTQDSTEASATVAAGWGKAVTNANRRVN
ncbi:S49 family peptidase [Mesorhizobium sp. C280B]|uniref:S49 family peptidase n=1 Tax=unclassified Mesorhizobium TaxID=325217 RepID=UPI0003CE2CAA|nr:S49 family peptidase [Mesorhizobium sp. LSJC280B00]ESW92664.1 peptidase S49 [Mesorhizobium sp. LSJC280B00]